MPWEGFQPADILLFEGEDDAVDHLITYLTGSRITHSAIYWRDGIVVDAGVVGVARHQLTPMPTGRKIFVRRLSSELPPEPVLDAAFGYAGTDEPYDWSGLALLALLLTYKKVSLPGPLQAPLLALLRRVVLRMDHWIDSLVAQGRKPMVCSQFVFQCFLDASQTDARYGLEVAPGTCYLANGSEEGGKSLLGKVEETFGLERPSCTALGGEDSSKDDKQLVQELWEAIQGAEGASEEPPTEELADVLHALGDRFRVGHSEATVGGLAYLLQQEPLFVTPADLQERCSNLVDVLSFHATRNKNAWTASESPVASEAH